MTPIPNIEGESQKMEVTSARSLSNIEMHHFPPQIIAMI